jgi:hypothetical protein
VTWKIKINIIYGKINFTKLQVTSLSKFTSNEKRIVDSIGASLSIKRIPDCENIAEIKRQTNKHKISRQSLYKVEFFGAEKL